jgi:hypothetical protein
MTINLNHDLVIKHNPGVVVVVVAVVVILVVVVGGGGRRAATGLVRQNKNIK